MITFLYCYVKVFIEFEIIFYPCSINIEGVTYSENELYKLDKYCFSVHKYFNKNEDVITYGYLYWDKNIEKLYMRMWLKSDELDYFSKEIFTGIIIPVNIRICPDTVDDLSVKKLSDFHIDSMMNNYKKD